MNNYEQENDRLIRWLSDKSPEIRHFVGVQVNWDFAERSLDWIVTREDCDLATAVELFWLAIDSDLISYPTREIAVDKAPYFLWSFDFISGIVSRATDGFYRRSLISYNLQPYRSYQVTEFEERERTCRPQGLPWIAPRSFRVEHSALTLDEDSVDPQVWSPALYELMQDLGTGWEIRE